MITSVVKRLLFILVATGTLLIAHAAPAVAQGTWTATSTTGAPADTYARTGVWTGSKMIVWGPFNGYAPSSGWIYDPATDTWAATSTTGAPSWQRYHSAVWTGSKMIVWGGNDWSNPLNTGGIYDPATDSWTATSTTGAPSARSGHTAVWTGSKMIVWGGSLNTGGIYDPATDSWTATSTTGAPTARSGHTAVWTGSKMIVWGGSGHSNSGGIYDPTTDTWTATSTTGAPTGRDLHTAVWSGSRMIVWGGQEAGAIVNTGGIYDPTTDSWTATSTTGAPRYRDSHTAVWTGSRMIIWGGGVTGVSNPSSLNTGGLYDPATDSWTATSTTGAPLQRYQHTAVWTGSRMIIWGGYSGTSNGLWRSSGGIYDPGTPSGYYSLSVSKDGAGNGTVTSSPAGIECGSTCSATYVSGTSVTLTASAASGSTFDGWSGACSGAGSCTVIMSAARSVTAMFTLPDVQLSNGVPYPDSMTGATHWGTRKYYYIDVPAGATSLSVVLDNLTADADLFVRSGAKPDLSVYDCSPWESGTTTETCSFANPAAGRWWIGVRNWDTGTIGYRVTATHSSVSLSIGDTVVTEGNSGTVNATFTVTLSAASSQSVMVHYATVDGEATAPADYAAVSGDLTFAPGATSRPIVVLVQGDTAVEIDERLTVQLSSPVNAPIAQGLGTGTILDDDATPLSDRELTHGANEWQSLAAQAGVAHVGYYRLAQQPRSSYEVVVEGASGDVQPVLLERLGADNATVLAASQAIGSGAARSLRWRNSLPSTVTTHTIRVRSGGSCTTACGADDIYRIRSYETTCSIPRFNNSSSQLTVVVLQNPAHYTVTGTVYFWSGTGTLLASSNFTLAGKQAYLLNTSSLAALSGQAGTITIAHDGRYGDLAGKAVALQPSTGFSFDSPMAWRSTR